MIGLEVIPAMSVKEALMTVADAFINSKRQPAPSHQLDDRWPGKWTAMVYVFFCVSGALGPLNLNFTVPKRNGAMANLRPLVADVSLLTEVLRDYPGAVIIAGNAWPFHYSLDSLRHAFSALGQRVVNFVSTLSDTQEEAIFDFMSNRAEPYVILASRESEFSELTDSRRVDVDMERGFDQAARAALLAQLRAIGEPAIRALSYDDMLRATVSGHALRRAKRMLSRMHAREDIQFQYRLRTIVGERLNRYGD